MNEMTNLRDALLTLSYIAYGAYDCDWPLSMCQIPLLLEDGRIAYFQIFHSNRQGTHSQAPDIYYKFSQTPENVLLVRPRRRSTAIREKLVLIAISQLCCHPRNQICKSELVTAAHFARESGYIVWHNPAKGGASKPDTAHFQAIPHQILVNGEEVLPMPCCGYEFERNAPSWQKVQKPTGHLLQLDEYPILGAVVWGSIDRLVDSVWKLIEDYGIDACNLIIEPPKNQYESSIRIFVFPRCRSLNQAVLSAGQMQQLGAQILLQFDGGCWESWKFASPELGLFLQGVYKPVYNQMRTQPERWGEIYSRLLKRVTPDEKDQDWRDFKTIFCRHF